MLNFVAIRKGISTITGTSDVLTNLFNLDSKKNGLLKASDNVTLISICVFKSLH